MTNNNIINQQLTGLDLLEAFEQKLDETVAYLSKLKDQQEAIAAERDKLLQENIELIAKNQHLAEQEAESKQRLAAQEAESKQLFAEQEAEFANQIETLKEHQHFLEQTLTLTLNKMQAVLGEQDHIALNHMQDHTAQAHMQDHAAQDHMQDHAAQAHMADHTVPSHDEISNLIAGQLHKNQHQHFIANSEMSLLEECIE